MYFIGFVDRFYRYEKTIHESHETARRFRFALGNVSVDTYRGDGTWRSLVARTLGVGEVPSSNLGVPKNSRQ